MAAPYRVRVFGKQGCDKCKVLNQRLDHLLEKEDWSAFEKTYSDVETEDGMVALAQAECINPQRIPALLVERREGDSGAYHPVLNPTPGAPDPVFKRSKLYQYLGLQTDYSDVGRGLITPRMIQRCLEEALGTR